MKNLKELLPNLNTYDSVIRKVSIDFNDTQEAAILISCRNLEGVWINLNICIKSIKEYKVYQAFNTTLVVLSDGIFYKEIDGLVCIDFSSWSNQPTTLQDFREVEFYFFAAEILGEILPYNEK